MKTKKIIEILTESNSWRRGGEIEMPDPEIFWIAIDEAIKKLNVYKEKLKENDESLNRSCIAVQTANLQKWTYRGIVYEVEILLKKWIDKNLILKVIENWKQRADLDYSIQYLVNNRYAKNSSDF